MAFLLPSEFRAPTDQEVYLDFDESEYEEIVAKLTVTQQAIFDKPVKHRHLKALYVKGLVDGKPMNKMLVDRGASVNLIPYTTFCKLGKGPEDLMETDMMLKDFRGNMSKTRGGNKRRTNNRKQDSAHHILRHRQKRVVQFAPRS